MGDVVVWCACKIWKRFCRRSGMYSNYTQTLCYRNSVIFVIVLLGPIYVICCHNSYTRLITLLCSYNILLTFKKMSWKLRYYRYGNKTCVKVHLIRPMLTFKLLLFARLILTLGSGVGFPHWSHNWTIRGLCNSLPLITATGWKRYKWCYSILHILNSHSSSGIPRAIPFPHYLSPRRARPWLIGMQECISRVCLYSH